MAELVDEQPLNPLVGVYNARPLNDPQRIRENERYRVLVKDYVGDDAINLATISQDQERDFSRLLVRGVFKMIGVDKDEHRDCYVACIDKCVLTHAPKATKWSQWGGYRDFCEKLKQAVDLTKEHNIRYILNAPTVIAAIAVKILRNVDTNGHDAITALLLQYRFFEYAHAAVKVYGISKDKVIRTGIPFVAPLTGPVILTDGIQAARDEQVDLTDVFLRQRLDMIPSYEETQFVLECKQFDLEGAVPRTSSPPQEIKTSREAVIKREEAVEKVGDLITDICTRLDVDEDVIARLTSILTEEIVKVLPFQLKVRLGMWAEFTKREELKTWVDQADADLEEYRWTQVDTIPAPPRWKYAGPMVTTIEDLVEVTKLEELPAEVRRRLSAISHKFNHYVNNIVPMVVQRARDEGRHSTQQVIESVKNMETTLTATFQMQMNSMVARGTKRVRFADESDQERAEEQNA